jgi:sec-independent protein translocase protein TatB
MEILGVGPSELLFIIIIALIVLGPKEMQKAGKTLGRWLNQLVKSDGWQAIQKTTQELRNMPTQWMREANMELAETEKELRKATDMTSASGPSQRVPRPDEPEHTIQPPPANPAAQPPEPGEFKPNQNE